MATSTARDGFCGILNKVCSDILSDSSFLIPTEGNNACRKLAQEFINVLNHPNTTLSMFVSWLCSLLEDVLSSSASVAHGLDREKMWILFHRKRSDSSFKERWESLLKSHNMSQEPLFYQYVTTKVFENMIKQKCPLQPAFGSRQSHDAVTAQRMTYEEENALRYIGGYIVRTLCDQAKKDKDTIMQETLTEFKGDVTTYPEESEEWTASIDRGGLTYITNATHQFLMSVEYTLRQYLNTSCVHQMDDTFRAKLTKRVSEADDVQFHWVTASCNIDDDVSEILLGKMIKLYVTIRGFSFASSVLEMYKLDAKKSTQKKKTLRQSLT